jgi:hypothetical protein
MSYQSCPILPVMAGPRMAVVVEPVLTGAGRDGRLL